MKKVFIRGNYLNIMASAHFFYKATTYGLLVQSVLNRFTHRMATI